MNRTGPLHILFLSGWYPNRIQPTLGNFVQKHAESVARLHTVSALHVVSDPKLSASTEVIRTDIRGVRTWNIYFKPSACKLLHAARYIHAHRLGWKLIRNDRGKPDLVHHNVLFPAGSFALYLKWFHGLKYIVTENWTGYLPEHKEAYTGAIRKWFTRLIANRAERLTPVSQDLADAMKKHGFRTPADIIYNVVETSLFTPGEPAERPFTFLHISTLLDDHKNISGMLRVIAALKKQGKPFRFVIAGDGDYKAWEGMAGKEGVNDVCRFGGEMTTGEVAERMKQADCFVLFSNYENLPCVMVEAMSAGLPVVATDVGGMPEHIKEWNGKIVRAKDEPALLSALAEMISEKGKYDPRRIREYALRQFSYDSVGRKFDELYGRILT